jgi:hypothetical protein
VKSRKMMREGDGYCDGTGPPGLLPPPLAGELLPDVLEIFALVAELIDGV